MIIQTVELPNISFDIVDRLQQDVATHRGLLQQIVANFERRYRCTLDELDQKLNAREITEHPAWEDSIEWRNGLEQLRNLELNERILTWLQSLITRSTIS